MSKRTKYAANSGGNRTVSIRSFLSVAGADKALMQKCHPSGIFDAKSQIAARPIFSAFCPNVPEIEAHFAFFRATKHATVKCAMSADTFSESVSPEDYAPIGRI